MTSPALPAWMDEVVLSVSELARGLGVNRATLATRAMRGSTQGDTAFPAPVAGAGTRGARYRLSEVLRYAEERKLPGVEGARQRLRLANYLFELGIGRLDTRDLARSEPETVRRMLALAVGRAAGVDAAKGPGAGRVPTLDDLAQEALFDWSEERGPDAVTKAARGVIDQLLAGRSRQVGRDARSSSQSLREVVSGCVSELGVAAGLVWDPCAGEGLLLAAAVEQAGLPRCAAQDVDSLALDVAALRLRLRGVDEQDIDLRVGDAFADGTRTPAVADAGLAVAELPYGAPGTAGNSFAWLTLIQRGLEAEGWAVVVCPDVLLTEHWNDRRVTAGFPFARIRCIVRLPVWMRSHQRMPIPTVVVLGPASPHCWLADLAGPDDAGVALDEHSMGELIGRLARRGPEAINEALAVADLTPELLDSSDDAWTLAAARLTFADVEPVAEACRRFLDSIAGRGSDEELAGSAAERLDQLAALVDALPGRLRRSDR